MGEIEHKVKTQFKHEQRVSEKKLTKLSGGDEAFADTDQEGFHVSGFGMGWPSTQGLPGFPLLDDGPIKRGEKGPIVGDDGIMIEQFGQGGLVKDVRSRYQSMGLLL